ncbi:MAG: hypothetical protein ACREJD_12225 [Phycisphaerales bacterium]
MNSFVSEYLRGMALFDQACQGFGDHGTIRPATVAELKQLLDLGVRTPELQMFEAGVFDPNAEGTLRVWGVRHIVAECTKLDPGQEIYPLGFVVIGSTHCGDAYALDCTTPDKTALSPVYLVSHERNWTSAEQIRTESKWIAANMPAFLQEAAKGEWND